MKPNAFPIAELVPHGPEMTLIDELVEYSSERSISSVRISPDSEFFADGSVPVWVGIEYMAQAVAAHVGFEARSQGEAPPIGFLLGTRRYTADIAAFLAGSCLRIVVKPRFVDAGLGSFACEIRLDGARVATAIISTYQPDLQKLSAIISESVP